MRGRLVNRRDEPFCKGSGDLSLIHGFSTVLSHWILQEPKAIHLHSCSVPKHCIPGLGVQQKPVPPTLLLLQHGISILKHSSRHTHQVKAPFLRTTQFAEPSGQQKEQSSWPFPPQCGASLLEHQWAPLQLGQGRACMQTAGRINPTHASVPHLQYR